MTAFLIRISFHFFVFFALTCSISNEDDFDTHPISLENSKIYGPGLYSNFTVPVRFFFIELLDTTNKSFNANKIKLEVRVNGLNRKCTNWSQLLKIKKGLFVMRFRLFEPCPGLIVDVTYEDKVVANSPYIIEGTLVPEKCYCPKPMSHWLSALNCPARYRQVDSDLSLFPKINMEHVIAEGLKRFNQPEAYNFCHYTIHMNKVYKQCYGNFVDYSRYMDDILLSLARTVYLPEVEMLVNLGDWPLEQRQPSKNPLPIFSWCGSESTRDIVMPTYEIIEGTLEMMGRVMIDIFTVMGNSGPAWDEKMKKAFWRGQDSRAERLDLVKIARQHPDKIDAALTSFYFFRKEEAEYGPKTEYVAFLDFFKHRYQIIIDGMVAAYRTPFLLSGKSLVLKQESEFYEHFYHELQPMVHYVPFHRNLSDLTEKIDWAVANDEEAKAIADAALDFALFHLLPNNILCYYGVLINEYSKRLDGRPVVHENMDRLKQPDQKNCACPEEELNRSGRNEL